jgi:hypothetical protein
MRRFDYQFSAIVPSMATQVIVGQMEFSAQ